MRHPLQLTIHSVLLACCATAALTAQSVEELSERLVGLTAVSGYESAVTDALLEVLPEAERDRAGNVLLVLGPGAPKRMIACPIDEWGFIVGAITDEGYLRLRRVGNGAPVLFDQSHEGHRVSVQGREGQIPGVVSIPSTHLMRGRTLPDRPFHVDDAFVDLGASSRDEVRDLGVDLLDAVAIEKLPHRYGESLLAAPFAGERGACAALAYALQQRPAVSGTVVAAFLVESRLADRGLAAVALLQGPFTATRLLGYPEASEDFSAELFGPTDRRELSAMYADLAIETIDLDEVRALAGETVAWMEGR